jgi:hypothetical protein
MNLRTVSRYDFQLPQKIFDLGIFCDDINLLQDSRKATYLPR